jgi:ATP-dependent RNA helicase DDX41
MAASPANDRPDETPNDASGDEYALPADYKPYVPVAKRRAQLLASIGRGGLKRARLDGLEDAPPDGNAVAGPSGTRMSQEEIESKAREKARRERTLLQAAQEVKERKEQEDRDKTAADLQAEEDAKILADMERGQKKLAGVKEIAEGKVWSESLKTSWRAPRFIRDVSDEEMRRRREDRHIIVEGEDVPPVIENFAVSMIHDERQKDVWGLMYRI